MLLLIIPYFRVIVKLKKMSRICKIFTICKISRFPHVCSSGSPDPERRKRRTLSGPVARGPVPREFFISVVRARLIPNGQEENPCLARSAGACPPRTFSHPICSSGSPDPERRKSRRSCTTEMSTSASSTVARGPVPRDRSRARWPGEGQALALRRGKHAPVKKFLQVL